MRTLQDKFTGNAAPIIEADRARRGRDIVHACRR